RTKLGRMFRVEQPPDLFLVLGDPATEFTFTDLGRTERIQQRKLGSDIRLDGNGHKITSTGFRLRQSKSTCRVSQQSEAERLLGLTSSLDFISPLGDRLRYVGKRHNNPTPLARLEARAVNESHHCSSMLCCSAAKPSCQAERLADFLRRLGIDLPRWNRRHLLL